MPASIKRTFLSKPAKRIYLVLGGVLLLFFIVNNAVLPWYVNSGGIITVPNVVGKKYENIKALFDSLNLKLQLPDTVMDNQYPMGVVIRQNPNAEARVKRGRRIYVSISGGDILVTVPNIRGRTLRDAKFALERVNLKLGAIEYDFSDQYPQNTVIEQRVLQGRKIKRDLYVSVVVSQGTSSDKVSVPDLNQKNLAEAEKLLLSLGLKVGNITYVPSPELLPNTVVQQFPLSGDMVVLGQAVDLFVVQAIDKKKELFEN